MLYVRLGFLVSASLILSSCQSNSSLDQIVSQKFVHKYGFDVSAEEWEERTQDGQIIEELKSGVKITRNFENGQLHGLTTYTYPNSSIIERQYVYDAGTLLKETSFDSKGMPIREDLYEFDDRNVVTLWNEHGIPLSVEEFENDTLVDGKYFNGDHELESKVENGYGYRIRRNRDGSIISRDQMKNGFLQERTTYHPNGEIHTISHYHDFQLHGPQKKFSVSGRPLMELTWNHGILDGPKVIYRNGIRVAEIPFVNGQKHGIESHFDDLGNLISETSWRNDKKHGCCKSYTEESVESEWFHNGVAVDAKRFVLMEYREQMLAELKMDKN